MTTTSEVAPKRLLRQYLERGWHVVGTVRGSERTQLHDLRDRWNAQLEIELLDITVPDDIVALGSRLRARTFDVVMVNAGVKNDDRETIADVRTDEFVRVMVTNALSPLRAIEALRSLTQPGRYDRDHVVGPGQRRAAMPRDMRPTVGRCCCKHRAGCAPTSASRERH